VNAFLAQWQATYAALQPREQRFVALGALAVLILLLVGVPLRLHGAATQARLRVERQRADLAYVQSVLPALAAAPATQEGLPLVNVVDATTRDGGLTGELRGTEPAGNDALRVRFEGASFEALAQWFVRLGRDYGVGVQSATLEHTDTPGRVNASVVLVRR
jgi:type II secretory pathway component PulM